jgi:hypothetical protein
MAGILYGAGLRLMGVRAPAGQFLDHHPRRQGREDRVTILPPLLQANLLAHLERIKAVHGVKGIKGARLYGIPTIHSDRR